MYFAAAKSYTGRAVRPHDFWFAKRSASREKGSKFVMNPPSAEVHRVSKDEKVDAPYPLMTASSPCAAPTLAANRAMASSHLMASQVPAAFFAIGPASRSGLSRPCSPAWPRLHNV